MNLFQKAILYCKREGLLNTVVRVVQKCWEIVSHFPGSIKEKIFLRRYSASIGNRTAGKHTYVIIPCIDWKIPLFQRPHQIAMSLACQENAHVLFVSDEDRYDNFAGFFTVNDHLDVVSHRIMDKLTEALRGAETVTVLMSWPRKAYLLESIPYDKFVYEYIDDISLFYYYTEEMKRKHYSLMEQADLVTCTARALYEDAKAYTPKVLLSPNAGDYAFFHENRGCPTEKTLEEKIKKYDCVIGYYGCLASWFDYDLVMEVARKMPQWCFVLVGYCFDGTVSILQNAQIDNIIIYPAQPYRNLPPFVSAFDIQTIPFLINEITKATSPVKLFEYMASGKPILTSAMPECLQYESVAIYRDADDFIEKVHHLRTLPPDAEYFSVMEKEACANTWDARVTEILAAIKGEGNYENK